jgi:hypothetical protein
VLEEGAERKDGKESSTPENSTNKTFQVLTLRKAHEPPESERFRLGRLPKYSFLFLNFTPSSVFLHFFLYMDGLATAVHLKYKEMDRHTIVCKMDLLVGSTWLCGYPQYIHKHAHTYYYWWPISSCVMAFTILWSDLYKILLPLRRTALQMSNLTRLPNRNCPGQIRIIYGAWHMSGSLCARTAPRQCQTKITRLSI